jgi:hypothetical protein
MVLFRGSKQYEHGVRMRLYWTEKTQLVPGRETLTCANTGSYFPLTSLWKASGHCNFTLERTLQIVVTDKRKVYFSTKMSYKMVLLVNIQWQSNIE